MPTKYAPIALWTVAMVLHQYDDWRRRYYANKYKKNLVRTISRMNAQRQRTRMWQASYTV